MKILQHLKIPRFRSFKAKDSSVIREIHFVSNFNNEMLFAEFQSGAVYKYDNVPFVVYKALKTIRKTGSVGSLFNELVKRPNYKYERVDFIGRFI